MATQIARTLQYLQAHPNRPVTTGEASTELDLTLDQASMALAALARDNADYRVKRVGAGIYQYDAPGALAEVTARINGTAPSPDHKHDWSGVKISGDVPESLRVIAVDKRGLMLVLLPNGAVARVEPL
jgi:hypothetical protein